MKIRLESDNGEVVGSYEVHTLWEPAIVNLLNTIESFQRAEGQPLQLKLESAGPKKIAVIKCIRAAYGLSLKDAKNLIDRAPIHLPPLPEYEARLLMREIRSEHGVIGEPSAIDRLAAIANPNHVRRSP